jgi:hypothetical protein
MDCDKRNAMQDERHSGNGLARRLRKKTARVNYLGLNSKAASGHGNLRISLSEVRFQF